MKGRRRDNVSFVVSVSELLCLGSVLIRWNNFEKELNGHSLVEWPFR